MVGIRFRWLVFAVLVWIGFSTSMIGAQPAAVVAHAPALRGELIGKGFLPVDGAWQFHLGDDPSFAAAGIDDRTGHGGWEELTADKPWGVQGHASYVGFAWYRRHIELATAPGVPAEIALVIPRIDDAYELYWNGTRIAGFGSLPPNRLDVKLSQPQQTYGLGPVRSGVLAVRVYKMPLSSVDDGMAGGFEATPKIGTPQAIGLLKTANDYSWLQHRQTYFGLVTVYLLASLLSFVAWLRDRRQRLLFWVAAFTFIPLPELVLVDLRLPIFGLWGPFLFQVTLQLREICQWYLLVYLLQLDASPRLLRSLRVLGWITVVCAALDGALNLGLEILTAQQFVWLDAVLTAIFIALTAPVSILLVLLALLRGRRLDHARWVVAFFAFATGTWGAVSNVAQQGVRYSHWSLGRKMEGTVFTIFGSNFPMIGILRILLFLAIVYAVLRYAMEYRRRQAAVEQELQAARELQQVLVPEVLPEIPGFALTAAYKPAQEVGGDFFQVIPVEAGGTLIVLGDVSGKGLKAAMTVSLLVGAVRMAAEITTSPAAILSALNRRLHGRMEHGFATCIALLLSPDGQCRVASAGHTSPFLDGEEIMLPGAFPLGLLPDTLYEEQNLILAANGQLSLYTDGLLEARNADGELYGFERLSILFRSAPTAARASEAAIAFGQDDDITVLTLVRLAG